MADKPPATLPADFFDKQATPPDTLPADFFEKQEAKVKKPKAGLKGDPGMGKSPEAGFVNRMAEGVTGLWNLGKSAVSPRPELPPVPGVPAPIVGAVDTMRQLITPREDIAKEAAAAFKRGGARGLARGTLSTVEDVPMFGGVVRQA